MASIAALIGFDPADPQSSAHAALASLSRFSPDDFSRLANDAKALGGDVRAVHTDRLADRERAEKEQDRAFLERAREFVELNEQVDASTQLLSDLSSFLSTFQKDLSAVSGHISELQGRSKTIEARLQARKAVERSLHPFLDSITLPPSLISVILDTDPSTNTEAWIPAVRELDAKLGAIRGGARVESRRTLDEAAEGLRVAASSKILTHLLNLLRPYTLSVSLSLPALHTSLLRLKPLFDFLRRHAARQAHEFQKAYAATVRWYYETGFRRYVRALEKVRTRADVRAAEMIGSASTSGAESLALLNRRTLSPSLPSSSSLSGTASPNPNASAPPSATATSTPTQTALDNARVDGGGLVLAHMQNDRNFKPPPESLFRSISLVLADNSSSEFSFLASFFGQHSSLSPTASHRAADPESRGTSDAGTAIATSTAKGAGRDEDREREKQERQRREATDALWKSVMEPALEYARNFTHALLDPVSPSALSLLSMIKLNDALLCSLTSSIAATPVPSASASDPSPAPPLSAATAASCPALEPHLIATRMALFPAFAKQMSLHADSLRKINGSTSAGGIGGMFGGGGGAVKDSVVEAVVRRYCEMFNAFVALSEQAAGGAAGTEGQAQDEEMVFSALLRLRQELDKLLLHQASKIGAPGKEKAFLRAHYQEMLGGLAAGPSRHARSQAEVAHYRELARKVGIA